MGTKLSAFQKVVIFIGTIPLLIIIFSLILPDTFIIQRSTEINAPPEKIFSYISDLRQWEEWSPMSVQDSTLNFSYEGSTVGIGAVQKWNGKKAGKGSIAITGSDPRKGIDFKMTMSNEYLEISGSIYFTTRQNGSNKLIWVGAGNFGGNPLMRYFGLFIDSTLGTDFEQGLKRLKELVEAKK